MKLLGTEEVVTSCWFSPDLHHKMLRKKKKLAFSKEPKRKWAERSQPGRVFFQTVPLDGMPFLYQKWHKSVFPEKKSDEQKSPLHTNDTCVFPKKKVS